MNARVLDSLLARELACIVALERAELSEKNPEWTMFLHEAKADHQNAAGQLETLLCMVQRRPRTRPPASAQLKKLQLMLTQLTRRKWTLDAMHSVETTLLAAQEKAAESATGLHAKALRAMMAHTRLRLHLLETQNAKGRVCMRCLLDRPGTRNAIHREDPDIYVCAACHDETLASFPPDLQDPIARSKPETREDRVISRALSKPSKQNCRRDLYLTRVAKTGRDRAAWPTTPRRTPKVAGAPPQQGPIAEPPKLMIALDQASPSERAYSETLFDASAMARYW